MKFPAEIQNKIISTIFAGVLVLLVAFVLVMSKGRSEDALVLVQGCVLPFILLPVPVVLWMLNNAYSTLVVDEKGVRVRRLIGWKSVSWEQIGTVQVWFKLVKWRWHLSSVYYARLRTPKGKRLLSLGSRYGFRAYDYLKEQAQARKITVSTDMS